MGAEKPVETVTVPDFSGLTAAQAEQAAADSGLYMLAKGADSGVVGATYQDIEAGTQVEPGTMITVEFTDHSAQD